MKNGLTHTVNGLEETKQEVFALFASWRENKKVEQCVHLAGILLPLHTSK